MIILQESNSSEQTRKTGKIFSKILKSSDILLLSGELGAGKTTFISGIASGIGVRENLTSPSFTILNIYPVHPVYRKKKLIHADFYRLGSLDEILNTAVEDYIYNSDSIICIEWGEKIKDYLKENYVEINFTYDPADSNKRKIIFSSSNRYWDKKLLVFKEIFEKCTF